MKKILIAVIACWCCGRASAVEWRMIVEKAGVTNVVTTACSSGIDVSFAEKDGAWSGRIVNRDPSAYVLGFEVWDAPCTIVEGKSRLYLPMVVGRRISNWPQASWTNRYLKIWKAIGDNQFELKRHDIVYPSKKGTMQWTTVNDGARGRLMMSEDPMAGAKEIAGEYNSQTKTLRLGWRLPMFLAQGDVYEIPRLVFRDYEGGWFEAAKAYRAWWNTCRTFAKIPEKVKDSVGFMMVIAKQQNDDIMLPYTEFGKFADTVLAYGLRHVEFHGWGVGGHDKFYPEYDPDPKMGGREGLKAGIKAMQEKGLHVSLYSNGQLQHRSDTKWYRENGELCSVKNRDGSALSEYWVKFKDYPGSTFDVCCPSNPIWRDRMLAICRQAKAFGAEGFFYDQIGNQLPRLCFDTRHGHRRGANVYTHDRETMLYGIIAAMQAEDPEFMIWSEQFNDTILGSVTHNQSLQYWTDKGNNILSRFNPESCFEPYPEMSFCVFPELLMTDRTSTTSCTRLRANETAVCNLRVDFEVRYIPDRKYIEEGIEPATGAYDNMAHRPSEAESMKAATWKSDRDYLRAVCDFRRANRDLLLRGTFRADEGFAVSGGVKIVANRWDGPEYMRGILVWNADPVPRKIDVKLDTDGLLVSASEPERGMVDPEDEIPANSLRLYRYRVVDMKPQNPARVKEIAKMLRPEAGFAELRIENRALWERLTKTVATNAVNRARRYAAEPLPVPDDAKYMGYGAWTKPLQKCREILDTLTFAECLENKGEFLPKIVETLEMLNTRRCWTGRFHDRKCRAFNGEIKIIELGNGMIAMTVSSVLDVLRNRLPVDVRARSLAKLRDTCLDTYLGLAKDISVANRNGCHWVYGYANWNAACNFYMTYAAICTLDDPMERAAAIECSERLTKRYLAGITPEGLCMEGLSYWGYGFGQYMRNALVVRRATGSFLDFIPPDAEKDFRFVYEASYFENHGPSYGDCNAGGNARDRHLGSLIWPQYDHVTSQDAGLFTGGLVNLNLRYDELKDPEKFLARQAQPFVYPARSWFPAMVGQLVCRPQPGTATPDSLYVAIQGSYNARPHGHHDCGSYCVAVGGDEVMGDPGNAPYTPDTFGPKRYENPMRNSYGHPVPRVDGKLQSKGKISRALVRASSFSDAVDSVTYDLKGAYRDNANLKSLTRQLDYHRAENRVVVTDHVAFDGTGTFETALTTKGKISKIGDGVYRFTSANGKATATCRIAVTGSSWHLDEEVLAEGTGSQVKEHEGTKPTRAAIVLDSPVTEAEVKVTWEK